MGQWMHCLCYTTKLTWLFTRPSDLSHFPLISDKLLSAADHSVALHVWFGRDLRRMPFLTQLQRGFVSHLLKSSDTELGHILKYIKNTAINVTVFVCLNLKISNIKIIYKIINKLSFVCLSSKRPKRPSIFAVSRTALFWTEILDVVAGICWNHLPSLGDPECFDYLPSLSTSSLTTLLALGICKASCLPSAWCCCHLTSLPITGAFFFLSLTFASLSVCIWKLQRILGWSFSSTLGGVSHFYLRP